MKKEMFEKELGYIATEEVRKLVEVGLENLPDYFFSMAASTTGKYHPSYALGEGGLVRHTKAVALFANYICQLEQTQNDLTQEERDCMIAGSILHDGFKEGTGGSKFTVHDHPQICANWILSNEIFNDFNMDYRNKIAEVISSHMGQWNENKRSKVVLQKPTTSMQKIVHLCDYLASRKDIEILFDSNVEVTKPDINTYTFSFGKYKGQLITEVAKEHKDYLEWMNGNMTMKEPLKTFVSELLK
ncbi:HD domain-containing protein [Lacrimispora sphenoides]|uniref:HD domain-containing protein n=1 Tax=Lacrimispora sphenoides TaxID=29370 RepID=UPI0008C9047E|nr:HD domain-containing protein [Lacrimispora sphenoides]SEU09801.1 HD domain-containing protein [Lacrimispora sphenoides]